MGLLAPEDERWLRRTLVLARRGRCTVDPNPRVGAVVVRDGVALAEGYHRAAGEAHAEVDALSRLEAGAARDATLYVNLEPCSHYGRTPPCCDAILDAGIRRVVFCHRDPNPLVAGRGMARLRDQGVEVAVGGPVEDAVALNLAFVVRQVLSRPTVTLKWAMSLDGKIATRSGHSQWISSAPGRRWALELREEHSAILVGSGTVLADDPRLNRRLGRARRPIVRVVLDRRLRMPASARMLAEPGPVIVYTGTRGGGTVGGDTVGGDTVGGSAGQEEAAHALAAAGATLVQLDSVTPAAVVADLARRSISSLLVEGGGEILQAFVSSGLFDRVAVCCAPRLIGGRSAPGPLGGVGVDRLDEAASLEGWRTRRRGPDLILEAWRKGCLQDLLPSVVG